MCQLPPPTSPTYWPARVGHLHGSLEAALEALKENRAPEAVRVLEEAVEASRASDEAFNQHIKRLLA